MDWSWGIKNNGDGMLLQFVLERTNMYSGGAWVLRLVLEIWNARAICECWLRAIANSFVCCYHD